jgi:hypothetical protein
MSSTENVATAKSAPDGPGDTWTDTTGNRGAVLSRSRSDTVLFLCAPPSNDGRRAVSDTFWSIILTLIPFLVLIPGAWALAVWAARQRDSQSKLVEKLTARKKERP